MGQAASRQEAFWEACGFGHVARVKRYIEEGIDVNWVSYTHDCCPIHVASQGKPEIVRLLLEQECNVNVLDIRGNTPLHHAAMKGHSEIMQTLISAGCKIDTEDKNGWSALHNAAYWCHYKAIKVLLKNKCDVSITNKDSRTALHEVARSKETEEITLGEIARLLIEAGSDINARGSDLGEADFTGLMFASYHGHYDVASAFIEAGCDLNACGTSNNWSALHWAADRGQDELVYLLLEAGIDPTIKNYRAETAADRAKSPEVKEMILNAINMFEEMRGLDIPVSSKSKSASNSQTSPTKNKVTNQMLNNIFSKMPPIGNRPQQSSNNTDAVRSKSERGVSNSNGSKEANQIPVSEKTTNQKPEKSSPVAEETNETSAFKSVIDKLSSEISEHTQISETPGSSSTKERSSDIKDVSSEVKDTEISEVKTSDTEDMDVKLPKFKTLSDIDKMKETKDNSKVENYESSEVKYTMKSDTNVKDTEISEVKASDTEDMDVKLPKFKTLSDLDNMKETKSSSEISKVKDEGSQVKDTDDSDINDKINSESDISLPKLKRVSEIDNVKEIKTSSKENTDDSEVKNTENLEDADNGLTELQAAGVLLGVMKVASQNSQGDDNSDDEKAKTGINDGDAEGGKSSKVKNEEESDEVMKVAAENLVGEDDEYSD